MLEHPIVASHSWHALNPTLPTKIPEIVTRAASIELYPGHLLYTRPIPNPNTSSIVGETKIHHLESAK